MSMLITGPGCLCLCALFSGMHSHMYMHALTHVHAYTHVHTCTYMHIHTDTCTCMHTHAQTHVHVYMYMHIYTDNAYVHTQTTPRGTNSPITPLHSLQTWGRGDHGKSHNQSSAVQHGGTQLCKRPTAYGTYYRNLLHTTMYKLGSSHSGPCISQTYIHNARMHARTYIHTYIRTHVRTYSHKYIVIHTHACTHVHTYIHT